MPRHDPGSHVTAIIVEFEATNAAREQALTRSRQVIRASATAIRAAHRDDLDTAQYHLDQAISLLTQILEAAAGAPSVESAGYVQDAMKEVAEARITLAFLFDQDLPGPADAGVTSAAWLNGLAEAASELRRDALDALRQNNVERAETLLTIMDRTYSLLVTVDFPDAVTNGIRRSTDQLRAVLERTRGDVAFAVRQERLEKLLGAIERDVSSEPDPTPSGI